MLLLQKEAALWLKFISCSLDVVTRARPCHVWASQPGPVTDLVHAYPTRSQVHGSQQDGIPTQVPPKCVSLFFVRHINNSILRQHVTKDLLQFAEAINDLSTL